MAILLRDWKPNPREKMTAEDLFRDDVGPKGEPSMDKLLHSKEGDVYYEKLGEEIERHPIRSAGIRRG